MEKLCKDVMLGFSIHRPELVSRMGAHMMAHDVIILEEPPDNSFRLMLEKKIGINDYLQGLDIEYPIFSRKMCRWMQRLAAQHKQIKQVEPYLETLLEIHEFFADGGRPDQLAGESIHEDVYRVEKHATAALLNFYQVFMSSPFEMVLESVKHFARKDAARFQLRDELRAKALLPLVETDAKVFIEAGLMHLALRRQLRRRMAKPQRLQTKFIADDLLHQNGLSGRLYGPGDRLTLLYIFHPEISQPEVETLLAARALIYNKLIYKSEIDAGDDIRNLKNEVACLQKVQHLSLHDCRRMYRQFKKLRGSPQTSSHLDGTT